MPIPEDLPVPIARRTLRELAFERLQDAILDGTLHPGEILHDKELSKWLGLSRTPIREALNDLERIGLVEMAAQRYTRVAAPVPEERAEILQAMGAVLGGVIRLAVPSLGEDVRGELAALIDQGMRVASKRDIASHSKIAWQIVETLIDSCPNQTLIRLVRHWITGLLYRVTVTRTQEVTRWQALEESYPQLQRAILDGDGRAAEDAAGNLFGFDVAQASGAVPEFPRVDY
ncbi:GntR family transcriptional regulator [Gryllotalpicola reticulitermitis]|uniref:GntR family transcriptional regulator n=1 Tax=Gryllotalpicola reticulitermitis TaxID=1184153 RepID=A0ABV8QD29_9MICO